MLGHNLLLLWIFTLIGASSAVLVNRTVDDGPGDSTSGPPVQYAPEIAPPSLGGGVLWRSQNNCDGCDIKPVNSDAESGTWTAIGYYPSVKNATATIEFQGSAIYIYLILANYPTTPDIVSSVHCNFRLDGEIVGNYSHPTDGSSRFEYNALAYANTSLPNANHTILLEITGPDPSYLIFDYAEYTTDEVQKDTAASSTLVAGPTDTTSATVPMKSFPIRAVIGGIIGGVAALGVIVFALFCFRRRSQRRTAYSNLGSRPLSDSSPYNSMSRPSQLEAERAELEEPLSEKRQTMIYLPAAYASSFTLSTPSNATAPDDSDLKTQVQALREQMKRMESLQRGNVSQNYLGTSQSTLHNHGVASNTGAGPSAHQRSMSMMKREQTLVVANATQQGELLVHTDSGIRLIAEASVIELPPTYEAV